jgi:hypothetical protein
MSAIEESEQSGAWDRARLVILGPRSWRPLLEEPLDSPTRACLDFLHDRHIGAPPSIVRELIRFHSEGEGIWAAAAPRLTEAFETRDDGDVTVDGLWMQTPLYLLTSRFAAPILRAASGRIGCTVCFGALGLSKEAVAMDPLAYSDYAGSMHRMVELLLAQTEQMGAHFWRGTAETLYGGIVRSVGQEAAANDFGRAVESVEMDQPFLTILRKLDPDFSRQPRRRLPTALRAVRSTRDRSGLRPKEGGVAGVYASQNLADLPDLLNSELLNPRVLLADKLVNGSFLVRSRPPFRRPNRHALIVGAFLVPASSTARRFAKAAWFQAAFRTAVWLARSGLGESELRWIERLDGSGVRCLRADLEIAKLFADDIWDLTTEQMMRFYQASMWRPSLSDQLTGRTLRAENPGDGVDPEEGLAGTYGRWLGDAFSDSWRTNSAPGLAASSEEFSAVHLQLFASDPSTATMVHQPRWSTQRTRFLSALDLPSHVRGSADLCLIPGRLGDRPCRLWASGSNEPTQVGPFDLEQPRDSRERYAEMIGSMIQSSLAALMEAGRNG